MPTITGNYNIIIINSTINDSVIELKKESKKHEKTKREYFIRNLEQIVKENNQSMLWLSHLAKSHLQINFSDLSDLSCVDLANLHSTVKVYCD